MNKRTAPATVFLFFAMTATALASPQAVFDQPVYNFGTVAEGTKVDHVFSVKNTGDSPLSILDVRPACGCTAANISSPTIQPGKTGEIKATFNSANFPGSMTKTIVVQTNDPKRPSTTLTLKGTVNPEVQVNPKQLNFGQVKAGVARTMAVTVENHGNKPLRLLSVKSPMGQVTMKAEKQIVKPGESARIDVSVTPRTEDRILSGYVTITTDNPAKKEIMVPVYGSPVK